jgi:hypothetical protein
MKNIRKNNGSHSANAVGLKSATLSAVWLWMLPLIVLCSDPSQAQTTNSSDGISTVISGEFKRIITPRTVNKFDLRGNGTAEDLIIKAYAESGVVSAPTITMLLIHQDQKSDRDYILVEIPPIPAAGDFYTIDSQSINCFSIKSSFFTNSDSSGRHIFMIRAVRDRSYGRSKISIDAYRLSPVRTALPESLYRFVLVAAVNAVSDACTFRQLSRLEQKLLNIQIKE